MEPPIQNDSAFTQTSSDISELLRRHAADPSDERAFTDLVQKLHGLIYHSALRRSGDVGLAEEITQTIFTVMARKAHALSKHPAPLSWVFKTTKLKTLHCMRALRIRKRKQQELENLETAHDSSFSEDQIEQLRELLDESLDHLSQADREIILQKYYEGRTYDEIGKLNGRSQSANKMRVKRALDNLSIWMRRKNAHLSIALVGGFLSAELSKAAPITTSKIVTASLSGTSSLPLTTLLTETFSTMSTFKSVSTGVIIALALSAIPYVAQSKTSQELDQSIRIQTESIASLKSTLPNKQKDIHKNAKSSHVKVKSSRVVQDLLKSASSPFDEYEFLSAMSAAVGAGDTTEGLRAMLSTSHMSAAELADAIELVKKANSNDTLKEISAGFLSSLSASDQMSAEVFEKHIAAGAPSSQYSENFQKWAAQDPATALAWLEAKSADGSLDMAGTAKLSPETELRAAYLSGLAATQHKQAITAFHSQDKSVQQQAIHSLTKSLFSANEDHALDFIKTLKEPNLKKSALIASTLQFASEHSPEESIKWVSSVNPSPKELHSIHSELISKSTLFTEGGIQSRVDWIEQNSPEKNAESYVRIMASNLYHQRGNEVLQWISEQPQGSTKDQAITGFVAADLQYGGRTSKLVPLIANIQEKRLRADLLGSLYRKKAVNTDEIDEAISAAGLNPSDYNKK